MDGTMARRNGNQSLAGAIVRLALAGELERNGKLTMRAKLRAANEASLVVLLPVQLAMAHAGDAGTDGAWPTQQEYAVWWKVTERTAQREWARYRQLLGAEADPYALAKAIYAEYSTRLRERDLSVAYDAPETLLAAV
jgi:hypothetical protein